MLLSHGFTMAFTWLLAYPVGVLIARYFKHKDHWLYLVRSLL